MHIKSVENKSDNTIKQDIIDLKMLFMHAEILRTSIKVLSNQDYSSSYAKDYPSFIMFENIFEFFNPFNRTT